jgi:hypothetical protein
MVVAVPSMAMLMPNVLLRPLTVPIVRQGVRHPPRSYLFGGRVLMFVRVRMPPKHKLLDDEKHTQPEDKRDADSVRTPGADTFYRLREQSQQRGADQRPSRKADEVRQHPQTGLLGHQQKNRGECSTRDTADRSEQDDPAEKGQGRSAFCYAKPITLARSPIPAC